MDNLSAMAPASDQSVWDRTSVKFPNTSNIVSQNNPLGFVSWSFFTVNSLVQMKIKDDNAIRTSKTELIWGKRLYWVAVFTANDSYTSNIFWGF